MQCSCSTGVPNGEQLFHRLREAKHNTKELRVEH